MARGGGGFPFRLYRAAAEGNFTGVSHGDGYRFEAVTAQRGADAEAYPWPGGASYRYMGTRDLYLAAGFHDLPVPPGYRPVMRRLLPGAPEAAATTTRKPPAPAGS
jgi:hypothetical protein